MEKVAVFGNAGGGKSTLSQKLSEATGLPLHVLDKMQFQPGGAPVSPEDYQCAHQQILATDRWIIDGFGSIDTLWPRLDAADTLVYLDLPLYVHIWWVTKRLITGYFVPPAGWPDKSPIWKSSMTSYRALSASPSSMPIVYSPSSPNHHLRKLRLRSPKISANFANAYRPARYWCEQSFSLVGVNPMVPKSLNLNFSSFSIAKSPPNFLMD
jgi:adenylate kinase family enzyme